MTICPECAKTNRDRAMFCINCGETLIPQDQMHSPPLGTVQRSPRAAANQPIASQPVEIKPVPSFSVAPNVEKADVAPFPNPLTPSKSDDPGPIPFPTILPEEGPPPLNVEAQDDTPFPEATETPPPAQVPVSLPIDAPDEQRAVAPFPDLDAEEPVADADAAPVDAAATPFPDLDTDEPVADADAAPVDTATPPFPDLDAEAPVAAVESPPARASSPSAAPFPDLPEDKGETEEARRPVQSLPGTDVVDTAKPVITHGPPVKKETPPVVEEAASKNVLPNLDHIASDTDESAFIADFDPQPPVQQSVLTTIPAPMDWQSKACNLCGFQNEPEAKYCGQCGTALTTPPLASAKPRQVELVELSYDGGKIAEHRIDANGLVIHGGSGNIAHASEYQERSHTMFRLTGNDILLLPPSEEGVYARIAPNKPVPLTPGSTIKIGHQLLVFEAIPSRPDVWGMLKSLTSPDTFSLNQPEIFIGRTTGQIRFSDDLLISGTHLKLCARNGEYLVYDLESTNGTFLQVISAYRPKPGQVFIIGSKIYKINSL